MLTHCDDCIAALLPELPGASRWLNSDQAAFFGATLFPTFEIVNQCPVSNSQSLNWERYLELRPQIIDLEASLAEEWLSPELMSALRAENLRGDLPPVRHDVVRQIKAQLIAYLQKGSFNSRRLADIVNIIRHRPSNFPEWHSSDTARLFTPPTFSNRKEASGYFF